MLNKLVVGAATLAVLGSWAVLSSSSVLAQPAPDGPSRPLFSREDAAAFLEARIAALHAGLQLTPEQERLWPPFEQAYRERGRLRIAGVAAGAPPLEDPIARMQRRADALLQQGAVLKRLADAAAPLWQSFDEGQKRRFAVLARPFNQRIGVGSGFGRGVESQGGAPGRDGGRFGFDGPRGFGPGFGPNFGPRMRFGGEDYGRGPRGGGDGGIGGDQRDGRDPGRDFGRGQFRWWRGSPETDQGRGGSRGGRRDGREDEERL
jgi:hypothetical protein